MDDIPGKIWQEEDIWHVDVRQLPPPEPMYAVMRMIGHKDISPPLIVHLDRDPVFLYPELAEHGWRAEKIPGESGEVRLKLYKD